MVSNNLRDHGILQLERELATVQTEDTYFLIEAKLAREKLRKTMDIVVQALTIPIDEHLSLLAKDLTKR